MVVVARVLTPLMRGAGAEIAAAGFGRGTNAVWIVAVDHGQPHPHPRPTGIWGDGEGEGEENAD
jgi:hypothetical protein